jgi:hypothetical protein
LRFQVAIAGSDSLLITLMILMIMLSAILAIALAAILAIALAAILVITLTATFRVRSHSAIGAIARLHGKN